MAGLPVELEEDWRTVPGGVGWGTGWNPGGLGGPIMVVTTVMLLDDLDPLMVLGSNIGTCGITGWNGWEYPICCELSDPVRLCVRMGPGGLAGRGGLVLTVDPSSGYQFSAGAEGAICFVM